MEVESKGASMEVVWEEGLYMAGGGCACARDLGSLCETWPPAWDCKQRWHTPLPTVPLPRVKTF